jgi:hypothetical protein
MNLRSKSHELKRLAQRDENSPKVLNASVGESRAPHQKRLTTMSPLIRTGTETATEAGKLCPARMLPVTEFSPQGSLRRANIEEEFLKLVRHVNLSAIHRLRQRNVGRIRGRQVWAHALRPHRQG